MTVSLTSITVQAFRGIPDERTFEIDGRDVVIQGPNGSGKSTLLQAIEFLLTGEISALRGSGTGGVRTTEHVPNLRADPDDCVVRGTFEDANGDAFTVYRRFGNRKKLVAERRPPEFRDLLELAAQGLLLLTREDLLELVIATPGDRKEQIYQLLDTGGVDERRRQLKRLARSADDEAAIRQDRQAEAMGRITDVVGDETHVVRGDGYEADIEVASLREAVNERREMLKGGPVASVDGPDSFREDIASPVEQAGHPLQRSDVQRALDRLQEWFGEAAVYEEQFDELRQELTALQADSAALSSLSELALVKRGRQTVDENTAECPLCGTSWDGSELEAAIAKREDRLSRIDRRAETIRELSTELVRTLEQTISVVEDVLQPLADEEMAAETAPLRRHLATLTDLKGELDADLIDDIERVDPGRLDVVLTNEDAARTVSELEEMAASLPDRSRLEDTWDDLKVLSDAYDAFKAASKEQVAYQQASSELNAAHREFLAARNDVLDDIFETVNARFSEIYRTVNPDEGTSDPRLSQTDTGVSFSVDFHDTGEHPPNALHSEGHQDLMGISLFLALAECLSPLERRPILLDDVVMAVDSSHRARFAELLVATLSDKFQFIVTTREEAWADRLREGMADDTAITFEGWTIDGGPQERRE